MALTAGLLTFLAVEALSEALELQAALPSALGGVGLVLLGLAISYLALTFLSNRLSGGDGARRPGARSTLVAMSESARTTSARGSQSAPRSPSASSRSARS